MESTQNPEIIPQGKPVSPVIQATLEKLEPLLGVWKGRGSGGYPTIEGFHYKDTFQFKRPGRNFLTYEQDTELVDAEGRIIRKSHWEAGILKPMENGGIELANVQAGGMVEVLRGGFLPGVSIPGSLTLRFDSEILANDTRLRTTSRDWSLTGDQFVYVMKMLTTKVEAPAIHLVGKLHKVE